MKAVASAVAASLITTLILWTAGIFFDASKVAKLLAKDSEFQEAVAELVECPPIPPDYHFESLRVGHLTVQAPDGKGGRIELVPENHGGWLQIFGPDRQKVVTISTHQAPSGSYINLKSLDRSRDWTVEPAPR